MKKLGTDGMPKLYIILNGLCLKNSGRANNFCLLIKKVFSEEYETIESEVVLDVTGDNQEKVTGIAEAAITINNPIN